MGPKLISRYLFCFLAVYLLLSVTGCQPSEKVADGPYFFPQAPDTPKLQFLTSFSGPADIGAKTGSDLDKFLWGAPEATELLGKPFGITINDGKVYVCDVQSARIAVFDLKNSNFSYLTKDRRLQKPINIFIDNDDYKYVVDGGSGSIFVFDENDQLKHIHGKDLKIEPIDVYVRGDDCYITDAKGSQIVVIDKTSGELKKRFGDPKAFLHITNLVLDKTGNMLVTDKVASKAIRIPADGSELEVMGERGDKAYHLFRPKGIDIDREDRIWVVDAGPAEAIKIYSKDWRFLMMFGRGTPDKGGMTLPADVVIDYDNIDLFQKYAVKDAKLEFVVLVTNQYGPNKVSVYGFGAFPEGSSKAAKPSKEKAKSTDTPEKSEN